MKDDTEFLKVVGTNPENLDEIHKSCGEPADFFSVESIMASCLTAVGKDNRNSQSPARKLALIEAELAKKGSNSSRLTIKEVNSYLDRLSLAQNRDTQISVFRSLIGQTNAEEMKFVISIILKDLMPMKEFEALYLAKNHGYFNFEAARLLSSMLKKENNLHLSARWRVHSTVRSATSVHVKLELHKICRKFNQAQVRKVYVVYDKPTTSVDVWIATRGPDSKQVQLPDWTNLNTQSMSPLNSRTFLEDEGALMSMVLGRGLEPYFFLGPPPLIRINAFFFPQEVGNESFPHLVSITTSKLISSWEVSAITLEQKLCTKVVQGCLFVCTKLPFTGPLDRTLVSCKGIDMKLPKFIAERIGGGKIDKYSTNFFLSLMAELSQCSTPQGLGKIKKAFATELLSTRFAPHKILDVLIQCTYCIEETQIQDFVEEVCSILANSIVGTKTAANPEKYLLDLLFGED